MKNVITSHKVLDTASLSTNQAAVLGIQYCNSVGFHASVTGTPNAGTITVETSYDYSLNVDGSVRDAGTWDLVTGLTTTITNGASSGSSSFTYDDLTSSAPFARIKYTTTYIETADVATVADSSGSLNSKYFLINGSNGTNWYVWYNINSAGVDPAIAGRTGIVVAGATNASANTLATATRTALAACTSIGTIAGATNHVTFAQVSAGSGSVTDGTAPTGFTITYTAASGSITAFASAKSL